MTTQQTTIWKDQRILITGGTRGLGAALTNRFVELGAKVAIVARGKEGLKGMKKHNPEIITIQADMGQIEEIHKIEAQAIAQLGGIDMLINNASTLGTVPLSLLADTECEELIKALEVNLVGPFRLIKAIVPTMMLNDNGRVINISSNAAVTAYEKWGAYSISKAGLDQMTEIWDKELESTSIDMVAVDPGDMYTKMHMDAIPDANPENLYNPKDVARDLVKFLSKIDFQTTRYTAEAWRDELKQLNEVK